MGKKNAMRVYHMADENGEPEVIQSVTEEKDLGILFSDSLSFQKHINNSISKANQMTGIMKRSFNYLTPKLVVTIYKTLIRPHLEYANVIWRPHLRKDINNLEKVQRRATKCVPQLSNFDYVDRLKILKLPTLEYRRLRGDMIQTYKLLHGLDDIDFKEFMVLNNNNRTRGHSLKLKCQAPKLDIRKHSFSVRIVKEWNSLHEDIVTAPNVHTFKVLLDAHWADRHNVY